MHARTALLLVLASTGLFVLFTILMGAARALPVPTFNIVDLEFSWTAERAGQILQAWGSLVVSQELYITYLDFGYLAGYGSMAFWLLAFGVILVKKHERAMKAAIAFMFVSLASPVADIIENVNLIIMMQSFPAAAVPINAFLASLLASIKFGMLFAAIGVLAIEITHAIGIARQHENPSSV
jgi:hypothetical protein